MPTNRVDVYPDGRIALCGDGHTLGNIRTGSIHAAWNGEEMRHFRDVWNRNRVMPMCFRCCGIMNDLKFDDVYTPKSDLVSISL